MRVVVDIQAAIAQRAGVGRYTKSLVEHLGPLAAADELVLFYFDFQRKGEPFPVLHAKHRAVRWCPGRFVQQAWKQFDGPPFDAFAGPADVYHFPNFIRPPLRKGKSVVTIHDLAFLRHPETIETKNLAYLSAQILKTVERSDAIIAVSEFTAGEIRELLRVDESRIVAIPEALSENMARPDDGAIAAARSALKLGRPYLLTVGTLEPRKNLPFLIDVFERLEDFDGDLLIAGMRGWKCEPILERIRTSKRAERIRQVNYVDDQMLPALYAGAELFVFPSIYEGFGFTPLEAMACGTPVIASTGGSLPEVLNDAAVLIRGYDADEWSSRVRALLGDSASSETLRERGYERAAEFDWGRTAQATWDLYRKLGR